jgi:hypothetical protein
MATEAEKRKEVADGDQAQQPHRKRARWDTNGTSAPASAPVLDNGVAGAPPGAVRPGLSLDALEKAKKALQMQKLLKEKLKMLPVRIFDPRQS